MEHGGKDIKLKLSQDKAFLLYREVVKDQQGSSKDSWAKLPVKEMKGLMYGAYSFTFASYQCLIHKKIIKRKRIAKMEIPLAHKTKLLSEINEAFYSWECISIILENRTIDLTIPTTDDYENLWTFISAIQSLIQTHSEDEMTF